MSSVPVPKGRLILFFVLLIALTSSPVWTVDYFVNGDGSGHLHTASLMGKLLAGDEFASEFYKFNSFSVPNSTGHWILLLLLQFFSGFTVTKIMVTLTYALFVAGAGWLRMHTVGNDSISTSLLIGAATGFNWLWLVGFYNFVIGVICMLFALAFIYKRRDRIGWADAAGLSLLFMFAYLSHIVSFLILAGSVLVIVVVSAGGRKARNAALVSTAMLPVIPLALQFTSLTEAGGGISIVWRRLEDPYSLASWLHQIRVADPFIIISRKAIPFFSETSTGFAVFTPALWLFVAFSCLAIASLFFYRSKPGSFKTGLPFFVLATGALGLAFFGPDDFSQTHGGVLRERFFICGLLFCIPLFRVDRGVLLKRVAQFCLAFIIAFQTLAVWEYARYSDAQARIFMQGSEFLRKSPSIAMVTLEGNSMRFHAHPIAQINCYNGVGTDSLIWDNYEFGHYLFPLTTRNIEDRRFIFDFTQASFIALDNPDDQFGSFEDKLQRINSSLESYNGRIETIALWGRDPRVEAVLSRWFETEPYFENEKLRLFRHK